MVFLFLKFLNWCRKRTRIFLYVFLVDNFFYTMCDIFVFFSFVLAWFSVLWDDLHFQFYFLIENIKEMKNNFDWAEKNRFLWQFLFWRYWNLILCITNLSSEDHSNQIYAFHYWWFLYKTHDEKEEIFFLIVFVSREKKLGRRFKKNKLKFFLSSKMCCHFFLFFLSKEKCMNYQKIYVWYFLK